MSVLDLGDQPLSNGLGLSADEVLDVFPLHLRTCPTCGLGQVGEYVLPERIFGDEYPYLSSTSASWVEHARQYATRIVDELGLGGRTTSSSRWPATTATSSSSSRCSASGPRHRAGQERGEDRAGRRRPDDH